ncbi:MAG: hypothetical protein J5525_12140 [Lachnospiraceae bacterium]|nr:hypothetical protein [Lachnospiraceae bacterium]
MVKCFCNLCQSEGNLIRVPAKLGDIDNIQLDFCEKCAQKVFEKKDWEAYKSSIKDNQPTVRRTRKVSASKASPKEDFMNTPAPEDMPAASENKKEKAEDAAPAPKRRKSKDIPSIIKAEEIDKWTEVITKASDSEIGYKTLLELNFGKDRGHEIWDKTHMTFDQLKGIIRKRR